MGARTRDFTVPDGGGGSSRQVQGYAKVRRTVAKIVVVVVISTGTGKPALCLAGG